MQNLDTDISKTITTNYNPETEKTEAANPQYMIPDRWSSKIYMEVSVAASGTHQTVSLHLRTYKLHIFNWNIRRPVVAYPAQLANYSRWNNYFTQSAIKA